MRALILAWLVGEGIVVYRAVNKQHRPPLPAEILGTSGLFVLLGLLAEAQPTLAATLGWGLDAAAFLNLAPKLTGGGAASTPSTPATNKQGLPNS